jgi:SAM-dependent methyltransferase
MSIDTRQLYEEYHAKGRFKHLGRGTFHADKALAAYSDAGPVLDFGCGNGLAVRRMRAAGHEWYGLEYSKAAYEKYLPEPYFFVGDTSQFADGQFDLTYSTEVFEHIPEGVVDSVTADLCRVTRRYMFLTISLRPSSDDNRYHCTLRPRTWWEERFSAGGFDADRPVIDRFQRLTLKTTRQILSRWSRLGPKCKAFAQNPPYELYGETQFWIFAFRRRGVPAPPLPAGTQWQFKRRVVQRLRKLLRLDPPHAASSSPCGDAHDRQAMVGRVPLSKSRRHG